MSLAKATGFKRGIALGEHATGLFGGTIDPAVSGFDGPVGSLYLSRTATGVAGRTFKKFDTGTQDWQEFAKRGNATTTDPTVTDDDSGGYSVGSIWLNTTSEFFWVCMDNTATAAVWTNLVDVFSGSGFVSQASFFQTEPFQFTNVTYPTVLAHTHSHTPTEQADFVIWWSLELSGNANKGAGAQILVDGVAVGDHVYETQGIGVFSGFSGLFPINWDATQHDVEVKYGYTGAGNSVRIRRIRTEILKVS